MKIHSFTVYKTDEGYRIRLEGEDIPRALTAGVFAATSRQLLVETKKLMRNMVVQKLKNYGGQLVSADEAEQLAMAQKRLDARCQDDRVLRLKPVPANQLPPSYHEARARLVDRCHHADRVQPVRADEEQP
jgi:hypothetical protein